MTHKEFHKLPLRFAGHMSLDTGHVSAYIVETPKGEVRIQTHVRKLKNGEFGKSNTIYIFRGREFNWVNELLKFYNGIK